MLPHQKLGNEVDTGRCSVFGVRRQSPDLSGRRRRFGYATARQNPVATARGTDLIAQVEGTDVLQVDNFIQLPLGDESRYASCRLTPRPADFRLLREAAPTYPAVGRRLEEDRSR